MSNACVPIKTFPAFYAFATAPRNRERSFLACSENCRGAGESARVREKFTLKASQFALLSRRHAEYLLHVPAAAHARFERADAAAEACPTWDCNLWMGGAWDRVVH